MSEGAPKLQAGKKVEFQKLEIENEKYVFSEDEAKIKVMWIVPWMKRNFVDAARILKRYESSVRPEIMSHWVSLILKDAVRAERFGDAIQVAEILDAGEYLDSILSTYAENKLAQIEKRREDAAREATLAELEENAKNTLAGRVRSWGSIFRK